MVQERDKMIRVAFVFPEDPRWTGGVNYLYNLLFALRSVQAEDIEPIIFAGDQVDEGVLQRFHSLARIERHPLFNPDNLIWKVRRVIARVTGVDYLVRRLFVRQGIDIVSHCNLAGKAHPFKTIAWIPDFQHIHLPDFFPANEVKLREFKFRKWIRDCDRMILSSNDALRDYQTFVPGYGDKVRILHFVSQIDPCVYELDDAQTLCQKYRIPNKFFFLPNQFWAHKNHLVVVRALGVLKSRQCTVHVVCSGYADDLKNAGYMKTLQAAIADAQIAPQFHILGLIDYTDMLTLFRHAVSVINPSLFEGWSSTVEEAKSIGKSMILSDLPVHREQAPPGARYFDPQDHEALADILWQKWQARDGGPDFVIETAARRQLPVRTQKFGETFRRIIFETLSRTSE